MWFIWVILTQRKGTYKLTSVDGWDMLRSICLLFAACICSTSQAGYVLLDDFTDLLNTPAKNTNSGNDAENYLEVFNPSSTISSFTGPAQTDTTDTGSMLGGQRDTSFSIVNSPSTASSSSVALIDGGNLQISNPDSMDAELTLVYDANGTGLNQSLLDTKLFRFDVASSDTSSFDLTVSVFKQGDTTTASTFTNTFSNPATSETFFTLEYSGFSLASGATTAFDFQNDMLGKVEVTIGGDTGYDISYSSLSFTSPEPGTAVGIASLGLIGLMTRRRRR